MDRDTGATVISGYAGGGMCIIILPKTYVLYLYLTKNIKIIKNKILLLLLFSFALTQVLQNTLANSDYSIATQSGGSEGKYYGVPKQAQNYV